MTGGRRRSSPAPASPPENEDILSEILLRLPPAPSSLPRASLVCKRWRRLVSDPGFLRRFRSRHRSNAPLLGFFADHWCTLSFTPTLDPPDRIPRCYFPSRLEDIHKCQILGCRHGLVLLLYIGRFQELVVWDPVTGDLRRIAVPPGFNNGRNSEAVAYHGAVLRAADDVHGGGQSNHFQVVLVGNAKGYTEVLVCVYSSETGIWGDRISVECHGMIPVLIPSTLVGSSLYWFLGGDSTGFLEFDLDRQCLAVIDVPSNMPADRDFPIWVMPAEGGVLGFLVLSKFSVQFWKREMDRDGVAGWVLRRTIEMDKLLWLTSDEGLSLTILGFAEDDNVLFLRTTSSVFMVHIETMQIKKIVGTPEVEICHPFASVYTAGM